MLDSVTKLYAEGGLTLIVILALSIVALAVGLERFFATYNYKKRMALAVTRILGSLAENNRTMAQAVNASLPWHPATPLFGMVLDEKNRPHTELKREQARIVRKAKRRLWVLASIGAIAPFVGLFGTVLGVMESFHQIGSQGGGGFQVVSGGISEALIATAGGIFVGIEAVILFNYLSVYVGEYAVLIKEAAEELMENVESSQNRAA